MFTIVDLINNGNVLKLPEFANANLRAASKARNLSAFQSAAEYAAHGIDLLKEDSRHLWAVPTAIPYKIARAWQPVGLERDLRKCIPYPSGAPVHLVRHK